MAVSKATLVYKVRDRVSNIPSEVTDAMIEGYIEDAANDATNYTGENIDLNDIPAKYQNILINMGAQNLCSRMSGVGVDFNITEGPFNISRGQDSTVRAQQAKDFQERAEASLRSIGRKIRHKKVYG